MNKMMEKLNGNKKKVATVGGIAITIPAYFLINFFVDMNSKVIATETRQESHIKQAQKTDERRDDMWTAQVAINKKLAVDVGKMATGIEWIKSDLEKR